MQFANRAQSTISQQTVFSMNQGEDLCVWNGIRDFLIRSSWRLAYGAGPWVVFSSHRDEANRSRPHHETEQRLAAETEEFIREFVRTGELPKRARAMVRFYAGQRIDWATDFLRIFLAASADGVLAAPLVPGLEFVEWLLITAYNNRFPLQEGLACSRGSADGLLASI